MASDYGHEQTDKTLAELEKRIQDVYKQAHDELQKTVDAYFDAFWERDSKMRAQLEAGEITADYYREWRLAQIGRGERFEALRDVMAQRYTQANEVAVSYVNDATPGIYALNHNYMAYTIERVAGDIGFTLFDEQTVRRLIVEQPNLMPNYPAQKAIKRGIDLAWGKKQITASVTSGILQGHGVKQVADDLQKRIETMNRESAIRTARTALTGAENAGRLDGLGKAREKGIDVQKEWVATMDGRTRHSHRVVDGETVDQDKKFSNGLRYPGDPAGPGREVYNCRCTMIGALKGVREAEPTMRRVRNPETEEYELIEDMSYTEWEKWKKHAQSVENSGEDGIINIERNIFSSARTKKEAEEYAKKVLGVSKIQTTGIPLESVNKINEALHDVYMEYPQLNGVIQQIKVVNSQHTAAFGVRYNGGKISTYLEIDRTAFSRLKELEKDISDQVSKGFWSKKEGAKGVIWHEIGHTLEFVQTFRDAQVNPFSTSPNDTLAKYMAFKAYGKGDIATTTVNTAIANIGAKQDAWESISGYAATDKAEAFAEAISDASGNRLSEEIKKIVKGW